MLLLMPEHQRQSTQGKYTTIHKGELSQINIYDKNIEHTKISLFTWQELQHNVYWCINTIQYSDHEILLK